MCIREEALPFAGPLFGAAAVLTLCGCYTAAAFPLALGLFVCFFFRDPERAAVADDTLVISPADGKILLVRDDGQRLKISVFMSIFSVHVNRAPVAGRVNSVAYTPGKYLAAWNDKASLDNERNSISIASPRGEVEMVQIAGLVARRIIGWVAPGAEVARGDRVGLIRFGSRVDLLLPAGLAEPMVTPGEMVKAGETPLARWRSGR